MPLVATGNQWQLILIYKLQLPIYLIPPCLSAFLPVPLPVATPFSQLLTHRSPRLNYFHPAKKLQTYFHRDKDAIPQLSLLQFSSSQTQTKKRPIIFPNFHQSTLKTYLYIKTQTDTNLTFIRPIFILLSRKRFLKNKKNKFPFWQLIAQRMSQLYDRLG